ncbi:MAG TPA: methyltransferase domain-containing protein [Pyrinomonadaceae bacterium]
MKTTVQRLKKRVVGILGRERANRISAPYHDWMAQRRTLERLSTLPRSDLHVNLGCGHNPKPGWLNVDIARGEHVDIVWDLRRPLPFANDSCAAIFSEHVIEHLSRDDAERLVQECQRVLQPGGVLRISTPDAGRFLRAYADEDEFLRHPGFTEPIRTPLDRINQMMREGGQHLWAYDAPSLLLLLSRAGFSEAMKQEFGRSLHPRMQNLDTEARAFESLYVEAVK